MILLALLNIAYWLMSQICSIVLPALPQTVSNIFAYCVQLINQGLDIVGALFIDFSVIGPLSQWISVAWVAFLAVDLLFRLVGFIKLSRKN